APTLNTARVKSCVVACVWSTATFLLNPERMKRALPTAWRQLRTAEQRSARQTGRLRALVRIKKPLPPLESAKIAGLRYVNDERTPGMRRIGSLKRFRYVDAHGRTIGDRAELQRIKALVIPPAW